MGLITSRHPVAVALRLATILAVGAAAFGFQSRYLSARERRIVRAESATGAQADLRPGWTAGEVRSGLAIQDSFIAAGLPAADVAALVPALKDAGFDFRRCRPGDRFGARFTRDGSLRRFAYVVDRLTSFSATRDDAGAFRAEKTVLPTETTTVVFEGAIVSSFYQSIIERGEMPQLAGNVVRVFEYDIDFAEEVREGDAYRILMDRVTYKGEVVGYGRIHAAEYRGKVTGTVTGYWLDDDNPDVAGYYNAKGVKLKKFFLRAPLDVLRVTSRYGVRFHPTLKERRMHTGVDYGAPTGTRVWSVADGTVARAGWAGGYGKLIEVQHIGGLRSRYGHLSAINVKAGQRVSQRQVIGRVGSTGRSTGPHLHFELLQGGRHINPAKQKIGATTQLAKALMPRLNAAIADAEKRFAEAEVMTAEK